MGITYLSTVPCMHCKKIIPGMHYEIRYLRKKGERYYSCPNCYMENLRKLYK